MYTPIIIIFIFLLMILFMSFRNKWIIHDNNTNTSGCSLSEFGCCPDNLTPKLSPLGENCGSYQPPPPPPPSPPPPPPQPVGGCSGTQYGCCPDGVTTRDQYGSNCASVPPPPPPPPPQPVGGCSGTQYGCCPDGVTVSDQYGSNCSTSTKTSVISLIKDSVYQHCMDTLYKCCGDGKTPKQDEAGTNCPTN